jgi:MFS family permease
VTALRDRQFRRLFAGHSLSTFGDTALYLTLGMWAKDLTGSNAAAGSVFLALGLPSLFAPFTGHITDQFRRRPLMLATNAAMAAIVLSLLAVRSARQLWIIYAVASCYGIAFGLLNAAGAGLRKVMLADNDLAGANAALQTATQGLRIISPLAGAALYTALGGVAVAALDVVTFIVAIIALAGLRIAEPLPQPAASEPFRRRITAGFRHILAVPVLRQTTTATACAFCVLGICETVIFAVISTGLHRTTAFFGITNSVQGAGSILAGLTVTLLLRRAGEARTVGLSLACFTLASVCYRLPAVPPVLAGAALDGIGSVWLSVGVMTAAQRHTPLPLQGRVNAAVLMAITGPQTISIAAGTILINLVDYRILLITMAIPTGSCALMLLTRPSNTTPAKYQLPTRAASESGTACTGSDNPAFDQTP